MLSLFPLIHLYYILVRLEHLSVRIWILIADFLFLPPFLLNFWPFLDNYGTLKPNNSIRSQHLLSLFPSIHLYYILVRLERLGVRIWILIADFLFLTPFLLNFWTFLDNYGNLKPNNYIKSRHLLSLFPPIHLYYILVRLEHLSVRICILIADFLFLPPFLLNFWPVLDYYLTLKPNKSIRSLHLLSLVPPIHLYYILVRLEHLCVRIWILIANFLLLTPFLLNF